MSLPIINEIWVGILTFFGWVWDTIPKPLKFILFLFFIVFFGGLISNALYGFTYACTTDGSLMTFDSYQDAIDYQFDLTFFGEGVKSNYLNGTITSIEHNNALLILGTPIFEQDDYGIMGVDCIEDTGEDVAFYKPALIFFGIDILNYQIWLLFMIASIIISFGWKYYDQTINK